MKFDSPATFSASVPFAAPSASRCACQRSSSRADERLERRPDRLEGHDLARVAELAQQRAVAAGVRAHVEHGVDPQILQQRPQQRPVRGQLDRQRVREIARALAVEAVPGALDQPLRERLHGTRSSSSSTAAPGGNLRAKSRPEASIASRSLQAQQVRVGRARVPARVAPRVPAQRQAGGVQDGVRQRLGREDRAAEVLDHLARRARDLLDRAARQRQPVRAAPDRQQRRRHAPPEQHPGRHVAHQQVRGRRPQRAAGEAPGLAHPAVAVEVAAPELVTGGGDRDPLDEAVHAAARADRARSPPAAAADSPGRRARRASRSRA